VRERKGRGNNGAAHEITSLLRPLDSIFSSWKCEQVLLRTPARAENPVLAVIPQAFAPIVFFIKEMQINVVHSHGHAYGAEFPSINSIL